jgi:hypothetical protein
VQIYVDEQPIACPIADGDSVGALIARVREQTSATGRLFVGLAADGIDLAGGDYAETMAQPAGRYARYDFRTGDPRELVADALPFCEELLDRAEETRHEVVEQLTRGRTADGLAALSQCCAAWRQVHESIVNSLHFLNLESARVSVAGRPLPESVADMKAPLNQIRDALEAKDLVLISDVLEYEFEPVVRNWRDTMTALREAIESTRR